MNKSYRLKKNYEIEKVIQSKKSVGNIYYAIYYSESSTDKPKIAFSVSKKIGNAVVRNKEKRILREIIRNNISNLDILNYLIIAKNKSLQLSFEEKQKEICNLFNRISKKEKKQ